MSRKSGGNECIWKVIVNHTAPEFAEFIKDAQKEQINNIGYKNIKELLVAENSKSLIQLLTMERLVQLLLFVQQTSTSVHFCEDLVITNF